VHSVQSGAAGQLRVVEGWPMGSPSPMARRFGTGERDGRSRGGRYGFGLNLRGILRVQYFFIPCTVVLFLKSAN
jgi:hypothetical protein